MAVVVSEDKSVKGLDLDRRQFLGLAGAGLATALFGSDRSVAAQEKNPSTRSVRDAKVLELAQKDHIELLDMGEQVYQANVKDYTGRLVSQERIAGELGDQRTVDFKFLDKPFGVLFQYVEKAPEVQKFIFIDKVVFLEGKNDGKMLVVPRVEMQGKSVIGKPIGRDPADAQVKQSSLKPITEFGFLKSIINIRDVYRKAAERSELKQGLLKQSEHDGRPVVTIWRMLPEKEGYPAAKTLIDIDLGWLLPTRVVGYDKDNSLVFSYSFTNLKFNQGLTVADFEL